MRYLFQFREVEKPIYKSFSHFFAIFSLIMTFAISSLSADTPPIVSAVPNQVIGINTAFTLDFSSDFVTRTDGDPITAYALNGALPTGLSFDASTGTISGTPTLRGSFVDLNISATDNDGTTSSNNFSIAVLEDAALIGDYRFDACTVGTMVDDSGYGNNGAVQNVESEDIFPRHEAAGMVCRAGRFYSFVANYATTGTNLQSDSDSFSIAFAMEWSGELGDLPLITREGDYALKINDGKLYYKLAGAGIYSVVPNFSVTQNIATYVSFVVSGVDIKVYKGATLTDTIPYIYTNPNNNTTTYIGTDDQTNYFAGLLDEIKFYKNALDLTTITEFSGRILRACACCVSSIKIKGDYVSISDTYVTTNPVWDTVTYNGFTFNEPPLVFMLPSDNGGHSAYIRARNVSETGFEAANIEPQGEDGPHIAMDLSYIAVSRGVHDLGDYTLEACTIPVQTEQLHDRSGFVGDFNATNQTPYGTISCDANGCWTKIATSGTYTQPVVFATLVTAENELRDDQDNASGTELSRPWMTVAIKNDDTGIWVSLERSETTYGEITKPELVAYMITEGNIQSNFFDDYDNNVSYETLYVQDRFLGYDHKTDADQRFDFNRTYTAFPRPLVMANKQSRKDLDGGWFRLNGAPDADVLKVSIWEDRRGAYSSEGSYANPSGNTGSPIGVSANQDTERTRDVRDDGAAIVFSGSFQYAEDYQPTAGSFDAVEPGANFNTRLDTKVVNKPFALKYWSMDFDNSGNPISKVINSPIKVELIYSQNPGINMECNSTSNLVIPGSTKYTHFLQPNPYIDNVDYNITNDTAYRNVQVRFTYGADANGTAVDWLQCYSNSSNCNNLVYPQACIDNGACTASTSSARSEACSECYFANIAAVSQEAYSCSYDRFAIRPKAYDIAINGSTDANQILNAGASFTIDANATDYTSGVASLEYNATQSTGGTLASFRIKPTDFNAGTGCAEGLIVDIDDSNFTNGDFSDSNGKYTEVGDINITVYEDPNKVFATVDKGNINPSLDSPESIYTIEKDSIRVQFIPDHFKITASLANHKNSTFTYMSRDLANMSSKLDINITAENELNATTANYNSVCYAKKTSYDISYDTIVITPVGHLTRVDYNETNTSTSGNVAINSNMTLVNLNESIFSTDTNGSASIFINVNFDRDRNESVNPFNFTVQDINVTDTAGIVGTLSSLNQTSTFLYGRANAPKQRFIVLTDNEDKNVNLYFETYCFGSFCIKSLLPSTQATADIRWYLNPSHLTASDGNISSVGQKGGLGIVTTNTLNPNTNPSTVNVRYDGTQGYPYSTTMEITAPEWIIYNPNDPTATRNEFIVEFKKANTKWSGEHDTNTTTKDSAVIETNRRTMW